VVILGWVMMGLGGVQVATNELAVL